MTYTLGTDLVEAGTPAVVSCRVLKLARASYYRRCNDRIQDADVLRVYLIKPLRDAHNKDPTFGFRYLADEVRRAGWRVSRGTAWKLCSQAGILFYARRRRRRRRKPFPPALDYHVQRVLRAQALNRMCLTDISQHRTATEVKIHCCAITDVFSNRIAGYSISGR